MNRTQRRAAEHAARKAARKAGFPTTTTPNPVIDSAAVIPAVTPELITEPACQPDSGIVCGDPHCAVCTVYFAEESAPKPKAEISEARLAANRNNAQFSTGPTSPAGKLKVSTNAVKTALTGRTVLLPFDDTDAYQALLSSYQKEFQPVGPVETGLIQSLVDTCWRLERIPGLEYAQLEIGHKILCVEDPIFASAASQAKLELQIRQRHEKDFRNLNLQENRLVRRRDKEMKELRTLQETRKAKEAEGLKQAAQAALVAQHQNQPFNLAELGFEFLTQQFSSYMARLTPAAKQNLLKEALANAAEGMQAAA